MSSHPMVEFMLCHVNQEALLEQGRRTRELRLARGGPETIEPLRASVARWIGTHVMGSMGDMLHRHRGARQVESLDLLFPNRHR